MQETCDARTLEDRHRGMPAKMGAGTDGEYGLDVSAAFSELTRESPGLATAVAAIRVLMRVLKDCVAGTLQELVAKIRGATEVMKGGVDCSAISVKSGGELFLRFITLASSQLEDESFENARAVMLRRGEQFLEKLMDARLLAFEEETGNGRQRVTCTRALVV